MKSINYFLSIIISILFFSSSLIAEEKVKSDEKKDKSSLYSGLKFRSIGPALMSGRISDIVIHPENENVWYVTAGSGGVWKTENSGHLGIQFLTDKKVIQLVVLLLIHKILM